MKPNPGAQSGIRTIRSYVLRQGRLTNAQTYALQHHGDHFCIDFSPDILELNRIFRRPAPKVLDIGSGMGQVAISMAKSHPENDFLAVEVHKPGVGNLIKHAVTEKLNNIRIIYHDIVEILAHQLPNRCLDEVYIFFPDPWPKKRHHKRRLISHDFLSLLIPKLKTHGRLFIATDWQDLADHMLLVCDMEKRLINLSGLGYYTPRPYWRPVTKFEQRGRKLNHQVWDLAYGLTNFSG